MIFAGLRETPDDKITNLLKDILELVQEAEASFDKPAEVTQEENWWDKRERHALEKNIEEINGIQENIASALKSKDRHDIILGSYEDFLLVEKAHKHALAIAERIREGQEGSDIDMDWLALNARQIHKLVAAAH